MKKLVCLIEVPDKYTKEMYKVGELYEFNDERAKEVLSARTKVTNEPYFEEYVELETMDELDTPIEEPTEEVVEEEPIKQLEVIEGEGITIEIPKPKKKSTKKTKKD